MLNMTNILPAQIAWEITLSRKPTTNAEQNARKRIEYVRSPSQHEAKAKALAMPHNAAYRVSSIREARS